MSHCTAATAVVAFWERRRWGERRMTRTPPVPQAHQNTSPFSHRHLHLRTHSHVHTHHTVSQEEGREGRGVSLSTVVAHTFLPTKPTLCGNPSARRRGFQTALAKKGSIVGGILSRTRREFVLGGPAVVSAERLLEGEGAGQIFSFLGGSKRETLEAGCLSTAGLIKRAP